MGAKMERYEYVVPGTGVIVDATGEWTTEAPESSYNQKVLVLHTTSGERVAMSRFEAESVYRVRKV